MAPSPKTKSASSSRTAFWLALAVSVGLLGCAELDGAENKPEMTETTERALVVDRSYPQVLSRRWWMAKKGNRIVSALRVPFLGLGTAQVCAADVQADVAGTSSLQRRERLGELLHI